MRRPRCIVPDYKEHAVSLSVTRCERHEYEAQMALLRAAATEPSRHANVPPITKGEQ